MTTEITCSYYLQEPIIHGCSFASFIAKDGVSIILSAQTSTLTHQLIIFFFQKKNNFPNGPFND